MNPFSLPLTISRPLIRAAPAPNREQHEDAEVGAEVGTGCRRRPPARSARPPPWAPVRRSTRATGPCPPIIRIRLSPTTTTPSAELCWSDAGEVRDGQERRADPPLRRCSAVPRTGSSATSRSMPTFMVRIQDPAEPPAAGRTAFPPPGRTSVRTDALGRLVRDHSAASRPVIGRAVCISCHALRRDDQLVAVEGRFAEFGEDLAPEKHDDPVADHQVGQLVAAEQYACPAGRRHVGEGVEQQFLRSHVHTAVGVIATMSEGRCASVRATVTFCWLPPDSSSNGWPRAGGHQREPCGQRGSG